MFEVTDDQIRELAQRFKVPEADVRAFYGITQSPPAPPVEPPDPLPGEPPRAVITRRGRWTYGIVIQDGISVYGPAYSGMVVGWNVLGRRRAEKRARKELRRYREVFLPEFERFVIEEDL